MTKIKTPMSYQGRCMRELSQFKYHRGGEKQYLSQVLCCVLSIKRVRPENIIQFIIDNDLYEVLKK